MARSTLQDVLQAWGTTVGANRIRRHGREYHGPCPVCDRQTDGCRAHELNGTLIFACRCNAPFLKLLQAIGLGVSSASGDVWRYLEPKMSEPSAPSAARVVTFPDAPTIRYVAIGPHGDRTKTIGAARGPGKVVEWLPGTLKPRELIYAPDQKLPTSGPVFVCEGERDTDAAARLGLTAIGTVTGAGGHPEPATLAWAFEGVNEGVFYLWPDADVAGARHMAAVGAALIKSGIRANQLRVIDPAALGLHESGAGAADFERAREGDADPAPVLDTLDAAARAWTSAGDGQDDWREAVSTLLSEVGDAPEQPPVAAHTLLYERKLTALYSPAGAGKTTLVAAALAAITRGDPWCGEGTNEPGQVLLMTEEDAAAWVTYMRAFDADLSRVRFIDLAEWVLIPGKTTAERMTALLDAFEPDVLLLDSLSEVFRNLNDGTLSDSTNAATFGGLIKQVSRRLRCGCLMLHHSPRDGAGGYRDRMRDSTSFEGSVDVILALKRDGEAVTVTNRKKRRGVREVSTIFHANVDANGDPVGYTAVQHGAVSSAEGGVLNPMVDYDQKLLATVRANPGLTSKRAGEAPRGT